MISKIVIVFFILSTVNSENPAAGKPWIWKQKRVYVSPKGNVLPFKSIPPRKVEDMTRETKQVANCGVPSATQKKEFGPDGKIIGGTEVTTHDYPWQAALYINLIWFCGGALINEEYVLTAGHCLYQQSEATVVLGAQNLDVSEPSTVSIRSTNLITHENYQSLLIHNDIALIKFDSPVTYTEYILPICLPAYSDEYLPVGTIVTITGWGVTSDGSSTSSTLMAVDVPIYDHDLCNDYYGVVNEGIICTDSTGGRGPCEGDSGGPMNYFTNGKNVIRGIVSFGASAGCDSGIPYAFTRVEYFLDWIATNTGIAIDA